MEKAIKRYFPIFVLPTMIAFTLGFIIPFVEGVYLSFCKFTTVNDAKFIGFANYAKVFADETFVHAFWYTAAFTVVSVILINVLAFAVALLLTKGFKGTNIFRTVFFMPNLIGGIVLGYIWQLLLNGILMNFSRTLTYSSTYGFWGLIVLMCWQQIGYMMIIYIAGIQNIPGELIEAAEIDGANRFQKIWYINVPVLIPTIIILLILQCGSLLSVGYEKVYLLQNTTNLSGSEVISTYVYKVGLEQADFSFGAAADLFNSVINSTILILANFIAKRTTDQGLF